MFEYTDSQGAEAFAWLVLFVGIMAAGAIGCALHGAHREWKQYLAYRKVHARWREIVEGEGK